jgi:hypothetical protein
MELAGFRDAAARGSQILFARKFDPLAAPDVAAALRARRYESEVLPPPQVGAFSIASSR